MQPEILLDLSRLVSRLRYWTPTGIDRVEMAYAEEMIALIPERLSFCAVHPTGVYGRLPDKEVRAFLKRTRAAWEGDRKMPSASARTAEVLLDLWRLRPRRVPRKSRPRVLIHSSPHHLDRQTTMERILDREGANLVCLLHDLIPIEYPEYQRAGGADIHLRRIRTVARLASAVITNSEATRRSFLPYLAADGRDIPVRVAHLGVDGLSDPRRRPEGLDQGDTCPYFVCVGTIEARKNHLLLLNVWRRLAETLPAEAVPRLILVGRRGWENEQVIDMLERCPALSNCVKELNGLPDGAMKELIEGARALLMPSFAEGFGMPVAEALALGVPVICSDLPAFREAGGDAPQFLDPLDGPGWIDAIRDYSQPDSAGHKAQLCRIKGWRPAQWRDHVQAVLDEAQRTIQ